MANIDNRKNDPDALYFGCQSGNYCYFVFRWGMFLLVDGTETEATVTFDWADPPSDQDRIELMKWFKERTEGGPLLTGAN